MNKINKKTLILIIGIIILVLTIYIFSTKDNENYTVEDILNNEILNNTQNKEENKKIKIYITGAIKTEGVYEIDEVSRVSDAINIAGGLKEDADITHINLASILEDGVKIYIPTIKETEEENKDYSYEKSIEDKTDQYVVKNNSNISDSNNNNKNTKVNINTANESQLQTLIGIGEATAKKIITYRKEHGKFNKIEDIKNVSGIGESKYLKIRDFICI